MNNSYTEEEQKIRDFILSEQNIYNAYHSYNSYIEEKHFNDILKIDLYEISDVYNKKTIELVIKEVRKILEKIIDGKCFFEVYLKRGLKSYDKDNKKYIYRFIHIPKNIYDLIAMVSILNFFMFDFNNGEHSKLTQSIPSNFYGHIVSDGVDEIFELWNTKYKEYQSKYIEKIKVYQETKEYKNLINLDFKNFFPTINPNIAINYSLEVMNLKDNELVKELLSKLLYVKINFEGNEKYINDYYEEVYKESSYFTIGLPQGLPQSSFFANVVMTLISEEINSFYKCESLFYVDDGVIFSNESYNKIKDISSLNTQINNRLKSYDKIKNDMFMEHKRKYKLNIHDFGNDSKTTLDKIDEIKGMNLHLYTLSKSASNIGFEMFIGTDKSEEKTLLSKTQALNELIKDQISKLGPYKNNQAVFLERMKRFFKYRETFLGIKTESEKISELKISITSKLRVIKHLKNEIKIIYINNHLLELELSLFHNLNTSDEDRNEILLLIGEIDKSNDLLLANYLPETHFRYKNKIYSLTEEINYRKVLQNGKNKNETIKFTKSLLSKEFEFENLFYKSDILENLYIKSIKFKRSIINTVISTLIGIEVSDDLSFIKKNSNSLKYYELRMISYVRNKYNDINEFSNFIDYIFKNNHMKINDYNVDYLIFEVLYTFVYNVRDSYLIDNLILTHHYVASLWSNGSILFKYYTLHNEIHATKLIKIITSLTIYINSQTLNSYEKYLTYLGAYLHDISMADMPNKSDYNYKDFQENKFDKIKKVLNDAIDSHNEQDYNCYFRSIEQVTKIFMDNLTEHTRKHHAKYSAEKINLGNDLSFINKAERSIVANISEAHTMEKEEIEDKKYETNSNFNVPKMINLLRYSDVLDISKDRTYEVVLDNSLDFIDDFTKYQWISHLGTNKVDFETVYKYDPFIKKVFETFIVNVEMKYKEMEQINFDNENYKISFDRINDKYEIVFNRKYDDKLSIPFTINWFINKNKYLITESKNFQEQINKIQEQNDIFYTKIKLVISISEESEKLSAKHREIVKRNF